MTRRPAKERDIPTVGTTAGLLRWLPRLTIRVRLTLAFTALVAVAGVLMVVIVNVFMRTVPTYFALEPGVSADSTLSATTAAPITPDDATLLNGGTAPTSKATTIALRSPIDILNTTFTVSAIVLLVLVLAGAVLAWLIAGRILRPLQAINHAAKLAGTGSLEHRVGLEGPRDEVRDLSDTFDDMLGRLDRAFRSHRRFAANASHELQTPLATNQTMLEVALADPDLNLDGLRAVAQRVLETNRRNIETVGALLDLAEIGRRPLAARNVDLDRLARQAVDDVADEVAARRIRMTAASVGDTTVLGDEVLLRQAVSNLVRNAVRHNVEGGEVDLDVRSTPSEVRVCIENTGPALDPDRIAELVEPFARGAGRTASAMESVRGHGLGLAIVTSVAEAHDGVLRLEPRDCGGLVVTFEVPRRTTSGAAPTPTRGLGGVDIRRDSTVVRSPARTEP